jgi:hypothetical protein
MATAPTLRSPSNIRTPELKFVAAGHAAGKNVCYWGTQKTGKTFYACSYPNPVCIVLDPNLGTLNEHPHIPQLIPESWDQIERDILPAIKQRRMTELLQASGNPAWQDYEVQTIIVDSYTHLAMLIKSELTYDSDKEMGYDGWDKYQARLKKVLRTHTQAALPLPGKPFYHAVGTIHEKWMTNEKGEIQGCGPAIQGSANETFFSFWSAILATDKRVTETGAGIQKTTKVEYFCHTIPPDRHRKEVVDPTGELPPKTGGRYEDLMKHWTKKDNTSE